MITWPFFPNWKRPYVESYSFLTEIIVSEDGTEQRRAWRNVARRSVSYQGLVHRDRLRAFRRSLVGREDAIQFPDEVRRAHVSVAEMAGSLGLTLVDVPSWMQTGATMILEAPLTRARRARIVDAVEGDRVTFTDLSPLPWPAGTRLMPALVGRLAATINLSAQTDEVAEPTIDLDVEPGEEPSQATVAGAMFAGLEVFDHRPNWAKVLDFQNIDPTTWVDFEIGSRRPARFIDFETTVIQQEHLIRSPTGLNQVLGLFLRMQGRRGEFYAPSWLNDIALVQPTAAGASTFIVAGHEFAQTYADDPIHRAFAVRRTDGGAEFFRVASIATATIGGAPYSVIQAAEAASQMVDPGQATISWMPVCRFASDEMSVSWITDETAQIATNLQTVGLTS